MPVSSTSASASCPTLSHPGISLGSKVVSAVVVAVVAVVVVVEAAVGVVVVAVSTVVVSF